MVRRLVYLSSSLWLMGLLFPVSVAHAHDYGDVRVAFDGVLEVTQSVQTAPQLGAAAVSLTAHKPTVIRAYISARRYVHVDQGFFTLHMPSLAAVSVDGTLTIRQGATVIAMLHASTPISVLPFASPNPEVKNSSLNFEWAFPPDGAVTFELDLVSGTPGITAIDPPPQDGTFAHNQRVRIEAVKVEFDHDSNPLTPPTKTPNATRVTNGKDWFLKAGPLAPCKLQYWVNPTPMQWTTDVLFGESVGLVDALALMRTQGSITYDNVYGWWQDGVSSNGLSRVPGCPWNHTVGAYGNTEPARYQRTFVHELFHTYHQKHLADYEANPTCDAHPGADPGPKHPNGEIAVVGWDTQADLPVPNEKLDVMVAGELTADAWLSPQRYQTMWNTWMGTAPEEFTDPCHFNWWVFQEPELFRPFGPFPPEEELIPISDIILVGGSIDPTGMGALEPAWRLSRAVVPEGPGGEGAYGIIIINSAGNPLGEWRFEPEFHVDSEEPGPAGFSFRVPTPVDAAGNLDLSEIQLVDPAGMILDALRPSPNPPAVRITSPDPRTTPDLGQPTALMWEVSDPDLDPLTCSVQYSPDGGRSYLGLAGSLSRTTMSVDPALLPGGSMAFFRVLCTDGIRTADSTAGPFAVPRKAPQVEIVDPIPDPIGPVTVCAGRPLTLVGFGSSPDDGVLPQEQLQWSSDLQGPLGTGNSLQVMLNEGDHALSLVGTDRAGDAGSASVSVAAVSIVKDTDGDGTPDCSDRCPTEPGPVSNDGCPEEEVVFLGILVVPGVGPDPPPEPRLVFESFSEVFFNVTVENPRTVPLTVQALRYHLTGPTGAEYMGDVLLDGITLPPGGSFVVTDSFFDVVPAGSRLVPGEWAVVVEAVLGINLTSGRSAQIFVVDPSLSFPVASVRPSNPMPAEGSQVAACVFIDMRNTPEPLGSYGAALRWDPSVLRFLSFTGGNPPFSAPVVNTANVGVGEVRFSDADPTGATGDVFVACFDFDVMGTSGATTPLDLQLTSLFTATSFTDILATAVVNDASVNVKPACRIGDVTLDGNINSGDALIVLAHEVGRTIPPEPKLAIAAGCGDANGDGATNSIDGNIVLSFEVGLPIDPSFPLGRSNVTVDRCPVCTGTPAAATAATAPPPVAATSSGGSIVTELVPSRGRLRPGEEFELAVVLDLSSVDRRLGSYGADLKWDPKASRFAGMSSAKFSTPLVNEAEAERGRLRFAAASPAGAAGRVEVVRLRFVALRGLPRPERGFDLRFGSLGATGPEFEDLLPLLGGEPGGGTGERGTE